MRVAIDFQPVLGRRTGVGHYAYYLAKYLPRLSPSDEFVGLSFGRGCRDLDGLQSSNFHLRRVGLIPRRAMSFLWKTVGWPPADAFTGPVDLFHFPSFVARPLRSGRAVVTIHDLAFKRMPELSERKNVTFLERHIPRTLERARLVLVDSEFTARELVDLYGYPEERIRVTYLGTGDSFRPCRAPETDAVRHRHAIPECFILCVATLEPRKNIGTLLKAYALLRQAGGDVPALVLVGGEGWGGEPARIERLIDRLRLQGTVVWRDYISHEELPALYSAACLFVFPSLYEGFGLPPLEAMACGAPVVCSNAPSLPEVVGDAALLVPPRDAECMAGAMRKLLDDDVLSRELIQKGLDRAKRFTWIETARGTLKAYREALL